MRYILTYLATFIATSLLGCSTVRVIDVSLHSNSQFSLDGLSAATNSDDAISTDFPQPITLFSLSSETQLEKRADDNTFSGDGSLRTTVDINGDLKDTLITLELTGHTSAAVAAGFPHRVKVDATNIDYIRFKVNHPCRFVGVTSFHQIGHTDVNLQLTNDDLTKTSSTSAFSNSKSALQDLYTGTLVPGHYTLRLQVIVISDADDRQTNCEGRVIFDISPL